MAFNSDKVIYLKIGEKSNIKAYVLDYLFDTETEISYVVIAADSKGTNAKVYEVSCKELIVLSKEDIVLFRNYRKNDRFKNITSAFEDGLVFDLIKREEKVIEQESASDKIEEVKNVQEVTSTESEEQNIPEEVTSVEEDPAVEQETTLGEEIETVSVQEDEILGNITYYVFDEGTLRAYQADAEVVDSNMNLANIQCIGTWQIEEFAAVEEFISAQNHLETVYLIADKMNDMTFENGTVKAINWTKVEPKKVEFDYDTTFYVYDGNVVKKNLGKLVEKRENDIILSNYELVETITGASNLDVDQFLAGELVEEDSYFVEEQNIVVEEGNITLKDVKQKNKKFEDEVVNEEGVEEIVPENSNNEIGDKIIVVNGDIDVRNGDTHYTIFGCVCTITSKEPFTVVAEKAGIKTITFEYEGSNSITETCQAYQNLYPNVPLCLLKGREITDSNEQVLEENEYKLFTPEKVETNSVLAAGKKVLTEEEMIAKRYAELKLFQKKNLKLEKTTPFQNYINTLQSVGLTEQQLMSVGLIEPIQIDLKQNNMWAVLEPTQAEENIYSDDEEFAEIIDENIKTL